jgi:bacterioferritin (cytochrome b1)
MKGSPEVIRSLVAALPLEAHLNIQYRHDWRVVKYMGVKTTAKHLHGLGSDAHAFMKKVADRTLFLGGDTAYSMAPVTNQATLTEIFANELALEMAIIVPYEQAIQVCMKALDDTSRNLFEHLLKWHQQSIGWIEQQQRRMAAMGGEAEYIQTFARK